ncbi:MAG: indolepyruvate ferredoxin oxidoreductase subunit alpha [Proteobacteria bacterium]|nr:indolepyruvate ferredoxin oxidoreductase subunit alpha [Pseudomonadota bacterium]
MKKIFQKNGNINLLLQGNEAIARGALEGDVSFCSGYPGNPSSEIIETLADAASHLPIYTEWSINEKVAVEAAAAASFAGLRSIVCMKQCGLNVASDFLVNLTLSGTKGGMVLVTCDDPSGISSTNEEDARVFADLADTPLLEPSTPQEALEMTKWAFDLSEKINNIVLLRSVSHLSHTRSVVRIGELPENEKKARFDTRNPFHTFPVIAKHNIRHEKLKTAETIFESSSWNPYQGPEEPELLIMACGSAWCYVLEAVEIAGLTGRIGILKLGTTWPLPKKIVRETLRKCDRILFAEEVDPFIETAIKAYAADLGEEAGGKTFMGKASGHIPSTGELNPSIFLNLFEILFGLDLINKTYREKVGEHLDGVIFPREFGFCPGCPHRGSYYAIKQALAWDNRDGFISGDIGCYTMGIWPTGFNQVKSVHAMGSGLGIASGYGKLAQFGFDQPVVTVCGDSTFYHAGLPGLINAKFNKSDILLLVLDNSATAMTGFQPHPGTGSTATGEDTEPVDLEALLRSLNIGVDVADPYETEASAQKIYALLQKKGPRVLIMKRKCALVQGKQGGFPYQMSVNHDVCLGESCGCGRYCTRIFRCPGLIWDKENMKATIDQVVCVGCGMCADICPRGAIEKTGKRN